MTDEKSILTVKNLQKSFGKQKVCDDISLTVAKGERRVILGPNGAGKTSFFNLLSGALSPDSGHIYLQDQEITKMSQDHRARLGIAQSFQKNNLFDEASLFDNLALASAQTLGLSWSFGQDLRKNPQLIQHVETIAEQTGLKTILQEQVAHISYGNRRQLEVAIALSKMPKLLLMDEPSSGVGPEMRKGLHDLIHNLPKDLTIIIIEHDMDLAFEVADRLSVLNYGKLVFEGTPEETKQSQLVKEIYLGSED